MVTNARSQLRCIACACSLALWVCAAGAGERDARPDLQKAARKAGPSIVLVESVLPSPLKGGEGLQVDNTGFFAGADGQVLTSIFAVSGGAPVRVRRSDGSAGEAHVSAFDQHSGIAMLETTLKNTTPLEAADKLPEVGQWLLAASAARGAGDAMSVALTPGLRSASGASLKLWGVQWDGLAACDMEVRPGCAAGPVLDTEGRLAGVILGARLESGRGRCYVLPVQDLKPIMADLLARKSRRLGWLGMSVARADNAKGLTVGAVLGDSPGFAAGIRPGDVLVEMDGTALSEPGAFESKVAGATPGTELALRFQRKGEVKTARVTVGVRPLLISRMPMPMAGDANSVQNQLYARALEARAHAAQQGVIDELTAQNRDLQERVQRLEERLQAVERQAKDAQE